MRVLWLSMTSSLYKNSNNEKNNVAGGWISSLEHLITAIPEIYLGIVFYSKDSDEKKIKESVTYYPIKKSKKVIERVRRATISKKTDGINMLIIKKIIDDFKPNIIHVFGTESNFGRITSYTDIPLVIHIQGILTPYVNAWFPPGFSVFDLIFFNRFNFKKSILDIWNYQANKKMAIRELQIFKDCKYFMGRTEWDKNVIKILSPISNYYYCSEVIRPVFYQSDVSWNDSLNKGNKIIIQSTLSSPLYKGFDLILKTAKILLSDSKIQFEWQVYGVKDISFVERKLGIKHSDINVKLMGIASPEELIDSLLKCDVYVHPSYIDNSPNSVCEAQILGVPTIVTNVGGLSSLVTHSETGIIIPANDPYMLAFYIMQLKFDKQFARNISKKEREVALERHNADKIIKTLMLNYHAIIKDSNSCKELKIINK